jgi:phosphopantetheine--protein transferase-like protein
MASQAPSIGNDVVDLDDPESQIEVLHPRWIERVFTEAERRALAASPVRHRLHWALWAAKESGYKALRRLDPEAVFSPRAFEIALEELREESAVCRGEVRHRDGTFALEVRLGSSFVHAIASASGTGGRLVARVERTIGDPGAAVRAATAGAVAEAFDLDAADLRVRGRPPVVHQGTAALDVPVSLSHHGRFVAFAFRGAAASRRDLRAHMSLAVHGGLAQAELISGLIAEACRRRAETG